MLRLISGRLVIPAFRGAVSECLSLGRVETSTVHDMAEQKGETLSVERKLYYITRNLQVCVCH